MSPEPRDFHELDKLIYQALKEEASVAPGPSRSPERIDWPEGKSPYPGLLWFDEEYASLFFGRDGEVDKLIGKMSEPGGRVVLVSGASGSGKSSVVAAGVWQAVVKQERLPGNVQWMWLRIQPSDGDTPFDALARKLKDAWKLSVRPDFTAKSTSLQDLLAKHLRQGQGLILFVDQLEELFTRGFMVADIGVFLEQLIGAAQAQVNRLRVVAAIRSEFIGKLEGFESTLSILNSGYNYYIGPVSPRALQDMIEKPARATGYEFYGDLGERMLKEAGQEPGNLPLVAYALKQLFEKRKGRTFTAEAYKAMGGVVGAIGTKADEVLSCASEEVQGAFDAVFAELVYLERERSPTRSRAPLSHFTSDQAAVQLIEALAGQECRVLVTSGSGQEAIVEVAHEKLFTAWPKLRLWIDDSGDVLREIDHAEEEALRWQKGGNNPQELWLGSRAKKVLAAVEQFGKHASPELQQFLQPQKVLTEKLDHDRLSHQDRLVIGQKLSEFGENRPGVGVKGRLPEIVWIDVPGGEVKLMEVDHVFKVNSFRMAKYPVTNVQFEAFLTTQDGYRDKNWWKDIEQSHEVAQSSWQEANAPRETVSWYEAVAFCRWLSDKTQTSIRLPTEWEWQQAAGGDLQREYPWEGGWDASRCSSQDSGLRQTIAVGMYPQGASQQGVLDMAGNVWEWCLNTYDNWDTSVTTDGDRVIRGGSWQDPPDFLRVLGRIKNDADVRGGTIGFRLVQDIP